MKTVWTEKAGDFRKEIRVVERKNDRFRLDYFFHGKKGTTQYVVIVEPLPEDVEVFKNGTWKELDGALERARVTFSDALIHSRLRDDGKWFRDRCPFLGNAPCWFHWCSPVAEEIRYHGVPVWDALRSLYLSEFGAE